MARKAKHPDVKARTAGICRRGNRYRYTYRVRGVQRWGSAATYDEARRLKRHAEADEDRGEARELATIGLAHTRVRGSRPTAVD